GLFLISEVGLFQYVRLTLNDVYIIPADTTDQIVIIALDDASLDRYGSTPSEWSRTVYVDMIDQLIDANPRVLAFDLLFSEEKTEDEQFAEALNQLRQNDARTRIVLATAGLTNISTQANRPDVPTFTFLNTLSVSDSLVERADYLGYTNTLPDIDSTVRRQASIIQADNNTGYSLSVATYLAFLRIPALATEQVVTSDEQTLFVTMERAIPVDEFGFWQPYYFAAPATAQQGAFPLISFVDVVDGTADMTLFEDKIVLIGLTNNAGLLDQYLVPSSTNGALMSGVEIQAHAVESLIQDKFIKSLSTTNEIVLIVVLTFFSSLIYAYPRWYFKVILLLIASLLWFVTASIIFSISLTAISLFDTLLAITIPFIIALGIDITIERSERQRKEFLLNSVQQIAEQRLRLEQAAQYILEDIQRIAPDYHGQLYFHQYGQAEGYKRFEQKDTQQKNTDQFIAQSYDQLKQAHTATGHETFPLSWRHQNNGLLVISHPQKRQLTRHRRERIAQLIAQLAPHIDNLLLHHEIDRQKSLLDAVIAESPASIAIVDDQAYIIQHNDDLTMLLNRTGETLQGQSLSEYICEIADDDTLQSRLNEGFKQQMIFHIDEIKIGKSVVSLDAAPLQNYGVWAVIIGDITSIVELSELKTQLLRIAAHDLKNPLSRIMGFAELLDIQLDLNERQSHYLSIITKAAEEMKEIITDILNLERLRSAKLKLEAVELNRIVREVSGSHQPDVIQKNQRFDIQTPDEAVFINADIGQLSQAISNLIGNAIKYTPDEGSIIVRVQQRADKVFFEVEDTGYGIPEKAQEKLFTEFYRARTEATSHIQGTGLGLSLTKSVIEGHGGEIGFTSEERVGSTFYFALPVLEMESNNELD
ncbi:MAG: CHASE2 domain-containing protein, partial [Anaerolineae bacterium]